MDVHNFSFDNKTTSNAYFQEQTFLSPNIIEDPIASLLQPVMKVDVATFIDEGDQFQHIEKPLIWKEVCFPVLNYPENLMFHFLHDPLVSLL